MKGKLRSVKRGMSVLMKSDSYLYYLRELPYKDYLKTWYWKMTRELALTRNKYRCVVCDCEKNLNVHHKRYEHRGEEYKYPDDLVVLCKECHGKYHNKLRLV